jgi:hypothetical protein
MANLIPHENSSQHNSRSTPRLTAPSARQLNLHKLSSDFFNRIDQKERTHCGLLAKFFSQNAGAIQKNDRVNALLFIPEFLSIENAMDIGFLTLPGRL